MAVDVRVGSSARVAKIQLCKNNKFTPKLRRKHRMPKQQQFSKPNKTVGWLKNHTVVTYFPDSRCWLEFVVRTLWRLQKRKKKTTATTKTALAPPKQIFDTLLCTRQNDNTKVSTAQCSSCNPNLRASKTAKFRRQTTTRAVATSLT